MLEQGNILIIDDNRYILDSLSLLLKQEFRKVNVLDTADEIMPFLSRNQTDMVLLDMNFACDDHSGIKGLYWLKKIKDLNQDIIVVLMVVYGMEERGVKAIREGADDFIIKPWNPFKLVFNIKRLLRMRNYELELKQYRMFVDVIRNAGRQILCEDTASSLVGGLAQESVVAEKGVPLTLEEAEKQTIIRVLTIHNGNVSQTASSLAITRATLYAKLDKYGIRKQ